MSPAAIPDLLLAGTALTALVVELAAPRRLRLGSVLGVAAAGILTCLVVLLLTAADGSVGGYQLRAWTAPLKATVLIAALCTLAMIPSHLDTTSRRQRRLASPGIAIFLLLASALGSFVLCGAGDLLTFILGIELASLPLYALAAFHHDRWSSEAAIKYLIAGALASAMLVFGSSYLFGVGGGLHFEVIASGMAAGGPLAAIGGVTITIAILFKLAAAPMHMWAPDVYQGAPIPVAAYIASASKATGLVALLLLLTGPLHSLQHVLRPLLLTAAVASMVIGNLGALRQRDLRRFMAYSSIAQIGFFLLAAGGGSLALPAIAFYAMVYALSTYVAFVIVDCLAESRDSSMGALTGLSQQSPLIALCLLLAMFSLAGIPPLAGYIGKFGLLLSAAEGGLHLLVLAAALNAVVGLYYYLSVVRAAYLDPAPTAPAPLRLDAGQRWALAVATPGMLVLGIWPGVHDWVMALCAP